MNSVSSGGQGMYFYWRNDHLFVKKGPTGDNNQIWTTFLMDMRKPTRGIFYYFTIYSHNKKKYLYTHIVIFS